MQILILSEDLRMASQIKIGLSYEGLLAEICISNDWSEERVLEKVSRHRIVLICANDALNSFWKEMQKFMEGKSFMLITGSYNLLDSAKSEKFFKMEFLKPLDYSQLSLLVRNELFNLQKHNLPKELFFKNIVLNLENRTLILGDQSFFLRNKEFALMRFFLENPGRLLTRMSILENVWDINADLFTNTVDVHVSRLRKLLQKLDAENAYIRTIPCSGYVFG
ncbi:MAG: winged helix-turn-helix domain-containing protein [Candidatus Altimarinota bacterium]